MLVAMPTAIPVPPLTIKFGNADRKHRWFGHPLVIIRHKIHRVLIHVLPSGRAQMRQPRFGVTHGRRRIVFDRTQVAFAVHEPFTHGPRLRHVHQRRVNNSFAVRMIVTVVSPQIFAHL